MKRTLTCLATLGLAASLVSPALAFEPDQDVDVIVPSSAGGGSDLFARTLADVIRSENLAEDTNYVVTNRPGGSGAVALAYATTQTGNNDMLITIAIGQIISSYALDWDIKGADMTPIAIMANDDFFLCALTDRFENAEAAIEAAKSGDITFGSSQKANSDHLAYLLLNKYAETNFKYVQFGGSGEVMSALLGGHVDVGIFNPGEARGQIAAGTVVPLASFSAERMDSPMFGDTPTFTELGYPDVVAAETRVVLGPPEMDDDAVAYYEDLLGKVAETDRWQQDYIARNNLSPVFMDSAATEEHLKTVIEKRVPIFEESGL
ncbi:tripartite tricarboxylate transporter substrate binding protein [Roseospira marina]|uniref:Tripartite tricarboxylate transporter substrate binding protein n=1 Tax=Roseospira marina TaxID=140057 RepID=A0A5M6I7Y7_9PROT|nr:tripartite tricarboxylate transporter substrate binding protein [Roseospira marina]KAA5604262.1 tripartite tricarboxylate transporter substrate binding protein [Roseospira marina]MBB4315588.1 putative tricarboxylic transport membrane protein [Roseospira marina]MBB5088584.1 putative tricarboxylic transport membrane protein [Roseospira marina]